MKRYCNLNIKKRMLQWTRLVLPIILICFLSCVTFANEKLQTFVAFSDLHFNPLFSCFGKTSCPLINYLLRSDIKDWDRIFNKNSQDGLPDYHKNTNAFLLKSMLNTLKKHINKTAPAFILYTGDFLVHGFRSTYVYFMGNDKRYIDFVKKTMAYLAYKIGDAVGQTPFYLELGNNDTYQKDYYVGLSNDFLKDTAFVFMPLMDKKNQLSFNKNFPKLGHYTIQVNNALTLLAINSTVFSALRKGDDSKEIAIKSLAWLDKQLQHAKMAGKKVLLFMHIPVGIDAYCSLMSITPCLFWQKRDMANYLALLQQYQKSIIAIIAGHHHGDGFMLLPVAKTPLMQIQVPAVSPVYMNNPAFKIFNISKNKLSNQKTQYLNLSHHKKKWQLEYDFRKVYATSHKQSLVSMMQGVKADNAQGKQYRQFYIVGHGKLGKKGWPYYWCNMHYIWPADYTHCLSF